MELRVLKYFLVAAREENITKAAALLHVTQPTLSRQLMQLEEELGVKLFRRGKYRVSLTEDGMLLRRRAQEIVELAEKTEQELSLIHISYRRAAACQPASWTKVSSQRRFMVMGRPHLGQRGTSSAGTRMSRCSANILRTVSSLS